MATDSGHDGDVLCRTPALGTNGLTAYFGLVDIGRVTEGDTVVVSAPPARSATWWARWSKRSGPPPSALPDPTRSAPTTYEGLDSAPQALIDLPAGTTIGMTVVNVA